MSPSSHPSKSSSKSLTGVEVADPGALEASKSVLGSLSRRGAPADPRVTKALETMKSCYSSDSTLKAHRLVERHNQPPYFIRSRCSPSLARGSSGSGCPKCPNAGEDDQPRKKSIVTVSKQSASSGNGSAKAHLDKGKDPADKGKEPTEVEEPEQGYTLWELCKVDDYAGADQYLAARMSKLP
ncbi:hypothetical protein GW17_00061567 [Ensete ventricosum]|nr:hypothetical protein GW17_00061567 [Ensete ventricosum]